MKSMKIFTLCTALFFVAMLHAQSIAPKIKITENPRTHNMHIVSDGKYYYTNNGGKAPEGMIHKFDLNGNLVATYDIYLDMRALMYNQKDKKFYVCTFEKKIYRITDMEKGYFEVVDSNVYQNEQATLAMSTNGKYLYCLDNGSIKIYKFPSGTLYKTINNIDSGSELGTGSAAIAVDKKNIYTWNADHGVVFVYDMKGNKIKSVDIQQGHYGFSLSFANGKIFVSDDGDYNNGTWYGYEF